MKRLVRRTEPVRCVAIAGIGALRLVVALVFIWRSLYATQVGGGHA